MENLRQLQRSGIARPLGSWTPKSTARSDALLEKLLVLWAGLSEQDRRLLVNHAKNLAWQEGRVG